MRIFQLLPILLFSSIWQLGNSQSNWYFGLELSDNLDYQYHLQAGQFSDDLANTKKSFGILAGRQLNDHLSLETGIISKSYHSTSIGQVLDIGKAGHTSSTFTALQIPIRLGTLIPLLRNRLFFTPTIGYSLSFNRDYQSYGEGSGGVFVSGTDVVRSERRTIDRRLAQNFSLIETGLGVSLRFAQKFDLNIHGKYYHSFTDAVSKRVVEYTLNDDPIPQIETFTTGSYLSLGIGLRYHFGN